MTVACTLMLCYAAVLDDGLLDVSYVMNYPREQVPTLLRELMRGREESDTLEIMDCFGSMRVKWLEVHCADGLQASFTHMHNGSFPSRMPFLNSVENLVHNVKCECHGSCCNTCSLYLQQRLCWQWGSLQLVRHRCGRVVVFGLACCSDLLLQSVVPANLQAHAQDFVSTAYLYSM